MKKLNRHLNGGTSKGFTLIEILLVLDIIAVLALSAFIVFPKVKTAYLGSHDRQAIRAYGAEMNGIFQSQGSDSAAVIAILRAKPEPSRRLVTRQEMERAAMAGVGVRLVHPSMWPFCPRILPLLQALRLSLTTPVQTSVSRL